MKRHRLISFAVVFLFVGTADFRVAAGDETSNSGSVTVTVIGIRDSVGKACVALYNSSDSYPGEGEHYKKRCSAIKGGKAIVVFRNIPLGRYAAYAFHDADGNGRLKTNLIGMPKEGVGASRGAKGFMGPPKFKDAAFHVGHERKTVKIRLRYL